jgi:hypothetical protein
VRSRWLLGLFIGLSAAHPPADPEPALRLDVKQAADLGKLKSFLTSASRYAPVLQPGPLGRSLGSSLAIDLLDPSSWSGTGLDARGPAFAIVERGGAATVGLSVLKPAQVLDRAAHSLVTLGKVEEEKLAGRKVEVAFAPGEGASRQPAGAVAAWGTRALIHLAGNDLSLFKEQLTAKPTSAERFKGLTGELHLSGPAAVVALAASSTALAADGRWSLGGSAVAAPRGDPLGAFAPRAIAWGRATLTPLGLRELDPWLADLFDALQEEVACARCSAGALRPLLDELTGSVAFATTSIKPDQAGPSSAIDRAGVAPSTGLAVIKDPARARAILDAAVRQWGGVVSTLGGTHWQVGLPHQQTLYLGLEGPVLYLSNSRESRDAVLASLAQASGQAQHPGEVHLDGVRLAKALGTLSVLDAARTNDLAILFGAAVEAGPLLEALGPVSATFDEDPAGVRIHAVASLPAR